MQAYCGDQVRSFAARVTHDGKWQSADAKAKQV